MVNNMVINRKLNDLKNISPIFWCAFTGICGLIGLILFILGQLNIIQSPWISNW